MNATNLNLDTIYYFVAITKIIYFFIFVIVFWLTLYEDHLF
jgi:hypothetical protein